MEFSWTPHRFSGGALALDLANSVVLRADPERRIDRFAEAHAIESFALAATAFCGERAHLSDLTPTAYANHPRLLVLRESIDGYFRQRSLGQDCNTALASLLDASAQALHHANGDKDLLAKCARSALRLYCDPAPERMKICGNCGWLFVDRSKNRSRAWCDMAVCGNRIKASRHYRRKRMEDGA